jgi:hypothetical protein
MAFDPKGAVRFDLVRGSVVHGDAYGEGTRAVLVPEDALADLVAAAGAALGADAARRTGVAMGARVAQRLGGARGVRASTLEEVADELGCEMALAGLGALSLERWGRALVVAIANAPAVEAGFLAAVVQGALETATGRAMRCAAISSEPSVRVLVAGDAALARVRSWLATGASWPDALARLQPAV